MTSIPLSTIMPVFPLGRDQFPLGFTFGASSSAFQYEGAVSEDGRGPSMWDTFCARKDLRVGNANDQYHRYKEDIALMKWMGIDAYRFSISWSRVLPNGKKSGVNPLGVKYYHNLIDELRANGIEPYVTIFHWDVPQALDDEYGGFLSRNIIEDFKDYADLCFMEYGNKVKHWMTINEPANFSEGGYASGKYAPGRGNVSKTPPTPRSLLSPLRFSFKPHCPHTSGDPAIEPYLVANHLLLAHAAAVQLYRNKYQRAQRGIIGLVLHSLWVEPLNPHSEQDVKAKDRYFDFTFNWFLDPVLNGSYPKCVQDILNHRGIQDFTAEESKILQNSLDFLGINYYTASYVCDASKVHINGPPSYSTDPKIEYPSKFLLGDDWGGVDWIKVYPKGLMDLLLYVQKKYNGPIYITENGFGEKNVPGLLPYEAFHDEKRVAYHHQHISYMHQAIKKFKVDVRGYFVWSLMDDFEWNFDYDDRFGTIFIDYKDDLKRYPKFSAHWFKCILDKTSQGSGELINTENFHFQNLLMSAPTDGPIELENGSVEEGESLEAKKNLK